MNFASVRKILLQTAFLTAICVSANLLAADRDSQQEQKENTSHTRLAISRNIMDVREKMAEYRISQSFFESAGDVAAVTAIGTALGCLAGLAHMLLTENLMADVSVIMQGLEGAAEHEFLAKAIRVGILGAQGGLSGFTLGIASQSGSFPQMSKGQITLVLALQNAIAAALAVATDYIGINLAENYLRRTIQHQGNFVDQFANVALDRRGLFTHVAMTTRLTDNQRQEILIAPLAATAASQAIALLLVIPEAMIIRSHRKDDGKKHQQLENAIKELQQALNEN